MPEKMPEETPEYTRFDLEQDILACWSVVDDLKMVVKREGTSEDFLAIARLYQIRFAHLWAGFEKMIEEGKM